MRIVIMTNLIRATAIAVALVLVGKICIRSVEAGLIVNGSFELPAQSGVGNGTNFNTGSPPGSIPGWTITSGGVQVYFPGASLDGFTAYDGNQVLDLVGNKLNG